jgi:hypothetical protein
MISNIGASFEETKSPGNIPGDFVLATFEQHFCNTLAANLLVDPQKDNGAKQGHQQGRDGDGIIDCPYTHQRGDEEASQERTDNTDNNIHDQILL